MIWFEFSDKVSDNRMLIKNHNSNSDKMTDNDVQIQVILLKQFKYYYQTR